MRVLIVDDEYLARAVLREMLTAHADVEIVGECANGFEAVKAIAELDPELVFLDIQMPKLDGFETVELAGSKPHYIFATAYDQFALRAFEVHAIDYLLKPFSRERLGEALAQARLRAPEPARIDAVVKEAAARQNPIERVLIRDGARVHVVATNSIDHLEAQGDYVGISADGRQYLKQGDYVGISADGRQYLKHGSLAELEAQLDGAVFVRIHRSHIVNLGAIARIEPVSKDNYCAVLRSGVKLPISRSGYARIRELLA